MKDGSGVIGFIFHYSLLFASFGSALLVFVYLACKKKLGFDEESKFHVFEDES